MKNRIWNEVLCLLGMSAASGAMAADWAAQIHRPGEAQAQTDPRGSYHNEAWTTQTYGLSTNSLGGAGNVRTTTSEPRYTTPHNAHLDTHVNTHLQTPVITGAQVWKSETPTHTVRTESFSGPVVRSSIILGHHNYLYSAGAEETVTTERTEWQQTATTPPPAQTTTSYGSTYHRRTDIERVAWTDRRGRLSVNATFAFNVTADFKNSNTAFDNIGSAVAGLQNRQYDNGFVRIDSGGAAGTTWLFNYDTAAQAPPGGFGNQIFFHSASGPDLHFRDTDKVQPGVEVSYEEVLGQIRVTERTRLNVGLIGGFGIQNVDFDDPGAFAGTATVVQDEFTTTGGGPGPGANHGASFAVAGPTIDDVPVGRTVSARGATGNFRHDLDGKLYAFRLGPFIEFPLHRRVVAILSGGIGIVLADTDYKFSDSLTIAGPAVNGSPLAVSRSGSNSNFDVLVGGQLKFNLRVRLSDHWSAEASIQYQNLGSVRNAAAGHSSDLDLNDMLSVGGGVNYAF